MISAIGTTTRHITAATAASGALLGYVVLNLATKDKLGLGMAIAAAFFSATINAIFHALAIQQIPIRGRLTDVPALATCAAVGTLGTGYIYAVAKKAALEVITNNNILAMSIAIFYQLGWVLPISLVLYNLFSKAITALSNKCRATAITDDKDALIERPKDETNSNSSILLKIAIVILVGACTAAFITNSAQAAYQLLKDTSSDESTTIIDSAYAEIYGRSIAGSITAHLTQAPWVLTSGIDGSYAIINCTIDLYKATSIKKSLTGLLALGVVGFTCVATYLIATYGQNNGSGLDLSILIFALGAAFLGNFVSGIKYAQGVIGLSEGPRAAITYVTDSSTVTTLRATLAIEDAKGSINNAATLEV